MQNHQGLSHNRTPKLAGFCHELWGARGTGADFHSDDALGHVQKNRSHRLLIVLPACLVSMTVGGLAHRATE